MSDRESLREEVKALRAGEDPTTPLLDRQGRIAAGQLWHHLLECSEQDRLTLLEMYLEDAQYAMQCRQNGVRFQ